ncbi:MAG: ABC transporter permease [Crocinitomicaceae bacterium]|nr:ABC transporter permease [Crocinitomicaceae bacterium]|tara:strand:- start:1505 stop:2362 length:858 start_codon:yes stop_codon:yes gene_type:complete
MVSNEEENWTLIINKKSNKSILQILKSIFSYKDLLFLFVKRDFIAQYKQTLLGPLWFFIQPILTTITFTIIFGNLANISTDGIPQVLFYMTGITFWNYFADCINKTSNTFLLNQGLFGKVYFPRLIVPLSIVITNLLKFSLQFFLLLLFWIYYFTISQGFFIQNTILFFPLLVLAMALLGLGLGIIISSLTTKYRDLSFLVTFGVQLLMYASPIVYPLSIVPIKYKWIVLLNPMTSIIETFKHGFIGVGVFEPFWLIYSFVVSVLLFFIGVKIFNKVEKSFIDTV